MNITLCSAFRDSTPYLPRYFCQVNALDFALYEQGHRLGFVWGEGDSTDRTLTTLRAANYRFRAHLVDCTHGGPAYGSVISAQRFRQLAHVGKRIFSAITEEADIVAYVESDLIWEPTTLLALIERVTSGQAATIAPMVLLRRAGWPADSFYDGYCFRAEDRHFAHYPPYHAVYRPDQPFQVDSVGSCVVVSGKIARSLHFDEQTIFPDLCGQIRAAGHGVWVDPGCAVYHL